MKKSQEQESLKENQNNSKLKNFIAPITILILVVLSFFYGKIPGRHGGLTPEDDPFFFWGTLFVITGMCINRLVSAKHKSK